MATREERMRIFTETIERGNALKQKIAEAEAADDKNRQIQLLEDLLECGKSLVKQMDVRLLEIQKENETGETQAEDGENGNENLEDILAKSMGYLG